MQIDLFQYSAKKNSDYRIAKISNSERNTLKIWSETFFAQQLSKSFRKV